MAANEFVDMEKSSIVAEPCVTYGRTSKPNGLPATETFEQQWQRALTVEDFRERCKKNLRTIYG